MRKKIPEFSSEDDESKFWVTEDSTEYVDWSSGRRTTLARLKPSLKTISVRLPESSQLEFASEPELPLWPQIEEPGG